MIIKCNACGTKLDIDEVDYECGVPSSTICPLCGVEVSFTIPKPEVKSRKPKASYKTHLEEKESPTSCDFVYCPKCGQMVSKKDEKCPNCGFPAKLFHNQSKHQVETANEVSTQQATIFNEPQQIQQPQRKKPLGLIVAIIILSLVVIGLLIAFLVTKCSQDSIKETIQTEILQSGLEEGNNQSLEQSDQYLYSGLSFRTFTYRDYEPSPLVGEEKKVVIQARLEQTEVGENLRDHGFVLIGTKTELRPDYTGEDFYEVTVETYSKTVKGNVTKVILEDDYTEIQFPNLDDVEEFKKTVRACNLKETEDGFEDNEEVYWAGTDVSIKGTVVTLNYRWEP